MKYNRIDGNRKIEEHNRKYNNGKENKRNYKIMEIEENRIT